MSTTNDNGDVTARHGPNWYIGKEHAPKIEEIIEDPIKCPCSEEMGRYKQYSGNIKIELECILCGRVEHTYGNLEGRCIVGGIRQEDKANE